jgi:hypothetical protein
MDDDYRLAQLRCHMGHVVAFLGIWREVNVPLQKAQTRHALPMYGMSVVIQQSAAATCNIWWKSCDF